MLVEYFDIEPTRVEKVKKVLKDGTLYELDERVPNELPTLAGFCCKIGVARQTLLDWTKAHPEFLGAIKRAKDHQERLIVANAMTGFYDKTFAIFTAKNLIDWKDKTEVDHGVQKDNPLAELLLGLGGSLKPADG